MSITDELRKWGRATLADTSLLVRMEAIADHIDAEHERAMADAYLSGTPTDEKLTELGWIRMPKDADGEYIHVGDVMEERSGHTFEVASLMAFGGSENWLALSDPRNFSSFREPHDIRHYHAPTVEDVLREFANEVYADADNEIRDRDFLCAKYAKRLKLAEGEDA